MSYYRITLSAIVGFWTLQERYFIESNRFYPYRTRIYIVYIILIIHFLNLKNKWKTGFYIFIKCLNLNQECIFHSFCLCYQVVFFQWCTSVMIYIVPFVSIWYKIKADFRDWHGFWFYLIYSRSFTVWSLNLNTILMTIYIVFNLSYVFHNGIG